MPLQPLLPSQIVGAPDWMSTEHFDILAKAEGPIPPGPASPVPLMLRALLAERFQLVVHNEIRELPVYALVPARSDRRTGPSSRPRRSTAARDAVAACPAAAPGSAAGRTAAVRDQVLVGNLSAGAITMAQFAMRCRGCPP